MRILQVIVLATLAAGGAMRLESSAFVAHGSIPAKHTCEGEDTSPPLEFADVPANAKSLALVVEDPDAPDPRAPKTTWVHWLVYDLPPTTRALAAGVGALPPPAREGRNDFGRTSYGGPCPPVGRHRYFFKLYALDTTLGDLHSPTRAELERAMKRHVLAEAELVGTYEKQR